MLPFGHKTSNKYEIFNCFPLKIIFSLMAQNDPLFALGLISMFGLDSMSPTIYKNLKVIVSNKINLMFKFFIFILFWKAVSLVKANRFEEAFVEILAILEMNLNHLANQGLVLKFTVRFLFFFLKLFKIFKNCFLI